MFALLRAFEAIADPKVQHEILKHSLDLLELSQESAVRTISHEVGSASELMGLLRQHAPSRQQPDHLLMLRGPIQDLVRSPVCLIYTLHAFKSIPCSRQILGSVCVYVSVDVCLCVRASVPALCTHIAHLSFQGAAKQATRLAERVYVQTC